MYHATWRERLPSILSTGLSASVVERNFPGTVVGVYLASSPMVALGFLIEAFVDAADDKVSPKERLEAMVVIVVDDGRIESTRLTVDPQLTHVGRSDPMLVCWLHPGPIDVRGMPLIDAAAAIAFHDEIECRSSEVASPATIA